MSLSLPKALRDGTAGSVRAVASARTRAPEPAVTLRMATVTAADGESFRVSGGSTVRRAAACLLLPMPGDRVLVAGGGGDGYILSVLERGCSAAADLSVPGAEALRLHAPALEVHAPELLLQVQHTTLAGRTLSAVLSAVEAVAGTVRLCADKLVSQAGTSLRVVDAIDSTVAGSVLVQVHQTYALQSEQAVIAASGEVRLDGKQISMG